MIVDCFTFFNEFDILEIRLHELDKWVDRFVLVECPETYSGEKKPLWFKEYKNEYDRIKPFMSKLTHLVAPPPENPRNVWDRIKAQTDYLMTALTDCANDDLILVGDVDEIPMGKDFKLVKIDCRGYSVFIQRQYFFYFNLRRPGGWPGTILLPYWLVKDFDSLYDVRMKRRSGHAVKSGGWHFTKIGDIDSVALKLKSSGHYNLPSVKRMWSDKKVLRDKMDGSRKIKGRQLFVSSIDDHPKWFLENVDRFKHMLTE